MNIIDLDRRAYIASEQMAALITEPEWEGEGSALVHGLIRGVDSDAKRYAKAAVILADALIEELDK